MLDSLAIICPGLVLFGHERYNHDYVKLRFELDRVAGRRPSNGNVQNYAAATYSSK